MRLGGLAYLLLLFMSSASFAADDLLSGKWKGTWTDKRPSSGNSGGPLWAEATLVKENTWKLVFRIDSKRSYEVTFKGRRDKDELRFFGYADAGDERSLYYWTAKLDAKGLSGTYEGVEEKGVFELARDPAVRKEADSKKE